MHVMNYDIGLSPQPEYVIGPPVEPAQSRPGLRLGMSND